MRALTNFRLPTCLSEWNLRDGVLARSNSAAQEGSLTARYNFEFASLFLSIYLFLPLVYAHTTRN